MEGQARGRWRGGAGGGAREEEKETERCRDIQRTKYRKKPPRSGTETGTMKERDKGKEQRARGASPAPPRPRWAPQSPYLPRGPGTTCLLPALKNDLRSGSGLGYAFLNVPTLSKVTSGKAPDTGHSLSGDGAPRAGLDPSVPQFPQP